MNPRSLLPLLLAALFALQLFALLRAPAAWQPASITVRLAPGQSQPLGRNELAAVQAQAVHLTLQRDGDGAWRLAMPEGVRPPVLGRATGDTRMGSLAAQGLRAFQVGAARFRIAQADGKDIVFTNGERRWDYDGATLRRDGVAQPPCPGTPFPSRVTAAWNRTVLPALTVARPLAFGGNLHCGNRLGLADIAPGTAQLTRVDGALRLSAATDAVAAVLADGADLRTQPQPLAGVRVLAIGASRYGVAIAGDTLTLTPQRRVALASQTAAELPPAVTWDWQQRSLWRGSGTAWLFASAAALALLFPALLTMMAPSPHAGHRGNILPPQAPSRLLAHATVDITQAAALLVLVAGCVSLAVQRAGQPPAAACSLLLGASALFLWLAGTRRPGLAGGAALLLFGAGLLAQLELGLGAPDTWWLRHYHKTAALLALGSGVAVSWRLWAARRAPLSQRHVEWLLAALTVPALALLAAQVLWGDETGVFDVQPVELAKLVLAGLTAHCLALRLGWSADAAATPGLGARWLRLIAPALLFLALLGCALVQVDDYSPLILLLLWAGAMALAYALAAGRRVGAALLAGLALAGSAAVPALQAAGPASLPASFYGDRFQVWLEPARHPHTGQQLLQGGAAVAAGGWFGTDGMLGLSTLGRDAGQAMAIPAVQDDFAPSFFLNRHGLLGGLLLWGLQAAVLAGLVAAAVRHARHGAAARDFRQAWSGRLRAFLLCGGAAFLGGHLLLSWGTNLAIVPVMGQPMSFLSAGGSHLLFFLLPLLGIHAATAQSSQE